VADSRTYLVECYLPDVDRAAVTAAGDRARASAAHLRAAGSEIQYLGALLVSIDEVVFHVFQASSAEVVRQAGTAARLPFERVVESVGVPGAGGVPDLAALLTER
jgi:hypothetical protein